MWNSNHSCGCSLWSGIRNLFDTSSWQNGCGCGNNNSGCGCGSNADLSAYTACGNGCYDPYYAAQYRIYSCGCNG